MIFAEWIPSYPATPLPNLQCAQQAKGSEKTCHHFSLPDGINISMPVLLSLNFTHYRGLRRRSKR